MLDQLIGIHQEVMAHLPTAERYLYPQIHWQAQSICLLGARGVGKTTMMCQALRQYYGQVTRALYISADNIYVASQGLFEIAKDYFSMGGEALFIDEVHKYPNWSVELKNIMDTYKKKQIVFSASSSVDLQQSKADLSRRVVYYSLKGLSFREYLAFKDIAHLSAVSLQDLLDHHTEIAAQFTGKTPLKHFHDYLKYGYFPFFLEGTEIYLSKLNNIIEKVIFEDIAIVYNLQQSTLQILKKLLWLIASSPSLAPNIDKISRDLGASREVIYNAFEYLAHAGLINNVYHNASGMKLIRKPGKIFLENSNLLYAITGNLKMTEEVGNIRESFFVNQCSGSHRVNLVDQGDFLLDDKYLFEIGGKSKSFRQIKSLQNAWLAVDGIEIGLGKKMPLYLFGLLY